jgi:hypothetical protein
LNLSPGPQNSILDPVSVLDVQERKQRAMARNHIKGVLVWIIIMVLGMALYVLYGMASVGSSPILH